MKKRLFVYFIICLGIIGYLIFSGNSPKGPFKITLLLQKAYRAGGMEKARGLLDKWNVDINAGDEEGRTPLHNAAFDNWAPVAKILLEKGANIEARDKNGLTPLVYAVHCGSSAVVSFLLEKGADGNARTKKGWTPLMYALRYGKPADARLLIEKGTDINAKNEKGWTPLMFALRYKKPVMAKLLIEKSADIHIQNKNSWTPLMLALKYGQPANAERLIEKGADIHTKNDRGWTPLMIALENEMPQPARLLIEKGADINAKNNNNWTPLMVALKYRQPEIAGLLIKKGADIHAKNDKGWTPLMLALENKMPKLARLLTVKGADINAKNKGGVTPLMLALRYGEPTFAEVLIKKGAHINAKNRKGQTPLIYAIKYRQPEIAGLLIKKGADIHAYNFFEGSVIHYAAQYGNAELVRLLAGNGAKINSKGRIDWTPLLLACRYGMTETAAALLEAGADIRTKSPAGWTPLMYALAGEHSDLIQLLKNKDTNFEKVAQEMKENAALYYLNALSEAEPARGKKEKEIIKKSLAKKWKKNDTIAAFLERNQYSFSIFQKSLHLKRCDFSFAALEKDPRLEVDIPPRVSDLSQVILLKGKYSEYRGKPHKAAELYTHFLTFLRQLSVLDSLDIKEAAFNAIIQLAPALKGYFEWPGKKKALCEGIYNQLAGYEKELFSLAALLEDEKQAFLFSLKRVNRALERETKKTPAPDADKNPEEALKYRSQALVSEYFSQLLKLEAPKMAGKYFGYYIKAAASNNQKDWLYADNEVNKLKDSLPKDATGKPALPDVDAVLKVTKEKRHERSKEFITHSVNILLVKQLTGPFKERLAEHNKKLEQLKQFKAQALQAVQEDH